MVKVFLVFIVDRDQAIGQLARAIDRATEAHLGTGAIVAIVALRHAELTLRRRTHGEQISNTTGLAHAIEDAGGALEDLDAFDVGDVLDAEGRNAVAQRVIGSHPPNDRLARNATRLQARHRGGERLVQVKLRLVSEHLARDRLQRQRKVAGSRGKTRGGTRVRRKVADIRGRADLKWAKLDRCLLRWGTRAGRRLRASRVRREG
jgi:hypothetical protein